jgi:hypothetical protein
MIAFTCKQCRRRHSRPDSQAGTLVFCECGQGNRVPWPDAASAVPDALPVPAAPLPAAPLPAAPVPTAPARPRPVPAAAAPSRSVPVGPRRADALPARKPARPFRKVRADSCLNHDEAAPAGLCAACKLPFCALCVVSLAGQTLCGPCKNFHIAALGRAARVLPQAVLCLVVALVSGPVTLILSLVAMGLHVGDGETPSAVALCLFAALLPAAALVLSCSALRTLDAQPHLAGRSLAASGACVAAVNVLWCLTVVWVVLCKHGAG